MENLLDSSLNWLDQWLAKSWPTASPDYQWLLLQTLATSTARRQWIHSLPMNAGGLVVDLGCGPGIMAQEIAALKGVQVLGLDIDSNALDMAQSLNRVLNQEGRVRFRRHDLLKDEGQRQGDLAVARFVAQHVPDLAAFFQKAQTHVHSGGLLAIEDTDDGFVIEYPEPPAAWQAAVRAFQSHQAGPVGDRYVGRKLAQAGVQSGLKLESVSLNPAVYAGDLDGQDLTVQFDIDRIERTLPALIQEGLIDEAGWMEAKAQYRASFPHFSFVASTTVRVLFRVP
ncbi:methyltransferase domain-containing protein [Sulfobacillus harzensis]|uniref:Methyltransferase domain-containing protein n=1 Tax=Sulfobacillus harzensis TaxID=2729629 RepID=A0A7Y0L509_9FIRM|nr:methyltransferase domain-containing protein [Sulfobacillus harzensis]NMP21984.1 methyltransferase domain-containing protein [Sulfobacillus harzensis]